MAVHPNQEETQHDRATIDVPTAAKMLGIGRSSAFRLAARGELPGMIRLGGRVVVSRRVLERLLDGESVGSAP